MDDDADVFDDVGKKNETNFDEPFEKRESQLKLKGIHQERKKTQLRRKVR